MTSGSVPSPPSDPLPPGRKPRASDGSRAGNTVAAGAVAGMFDSIAPVYDRLNTIMTAGADGRWRRAAARAAGVGPGGRALDVACGTGKLTAELASRVGPFGTAVGLDHSAGMLDVARRLYDDRVEMTFVGGDALDLPFDDDAFDAATIAFGLRNLSDFERGFREMARVVRPGGRVVCLELTQARPRWWGRLFRWSFRRVAPLLGGLVGARDAYGYLPASLDGFPAADRLTATMRAAGLSGVRYRRLGLGTVALHVGAVPRQDRPAG